MGKSLGPQSDHTTDLYPQSIPEHPVARTFRGSFEHVLDEKGRVSLPSVFRQSLLLTPTTTDTAPAVVITNFICDGARCLDGYALPAWEEFERVLFARGRFDSQVRKIENFYLARAVQCPVDGNGRILIPQHLRSYASLSKDVVFTSSLHGFRIWDKRIWDMVFQQAESALLEDPNLFGGIDTEPERSVLAQSAALPVKEEVEEETVDARRRRRN